MKKHDWFSRLGLVSLGLLGFLSAITLTRCFAPELPACSYRCAKSEPSCPDEYECRTDGYCHLKGNSEACPFTQDLIPPPVRDLSCQLPDLATPPDQSIGDAMPSQG